MISFKGRHHQQDIILQCVRWYVAYSLSYRDLEELMQERGYATFHAPFVGKDGVTRALPLIHASDTPIRRHRQLIAAATPYDPAFFAYFENRSRRVAMVPPWTTGSLSNDFIRA